MNGVWAKLNNTVQCMYSVHMVSCLYLTVQLITILAKTDPSVKVPPELKTNENSKTKIMACYQKMVLTLEPKHIKLDIYVYSVCVKTTEML